ncbi:MAG TPA: diacylglycerol kinase family lipid kinase, partial [Brevundimonas sp.]|nr:diacylglycerol kinase family lipid kinase [Brevundimonas sp.]
MSETLTPIADEATAPEDAAAPARALSPHAPMGRVVMLVNPLSGSVGSNAVAEAEAILAEYTCEASVIALEGGQF